VTVHIFGVILKYGIKYCQSCNSWNNENILVKFSVIVENSFLYNSGKKISVGCREIAFCPVQWDVFSATWYKRVYKHRPTTLHWRLKWRVYRRKTNIIETATCITYSTLYPLESTSINAHSQVSQPYCCFRFLLSINQSINMIINQSDYKSISQSINHSINHSINMIINQFDYKSINHLSINLCGQNCTPHKNLSVGYHSLNKILWRHSVLQCYLFTANRECILVANYLRQVNEVNGGDNAFVRCVFVCVFVCVSALRSGRSLELNANSSKTVKATDFKFYTHVARDCPDMTPKNFPKTGRGHGHVTP